MFDLDPQDYQGLWNFARRVAIALRQAVPCKRVGVAVIGLEVPHCHIHLVPLNQEGDMDFSHKTTLPEEQMRQLAADIAARFE